MVKVLKCAVLTYSTEMSAFFTLVRADSIKASTGCQWYINRAAMGCQPGVALTSNPLLTGW